MNAEFQRIARRDKKAFHQCKETEENNIIGKTRDLFKNISDTNGMSYKDGHNKGQKWYGPSRSRRYSEENYTVELYKKDLHDPDDHEELITHLSQTSWNAKSSGP